MTIQIAKPEDYQVNLNHLTSLGLSDQQIREICSTVISICAIGLGDPTTWGYSWLRDLLPVAISEEHPLYEVETKNFEDFAYHYVSGGYQN